MEDEDKGFAVRDRRIHHDPEAAPDAESPKEAPQEAPPASPGPPAGEAPETPSGEEVPGFSMAGEGPPIDFSAFVFSLARTALIHLGIEPYPETGRRETHLDAARETIDVLGMLEEKTRGNLTPEEGELISKMLYTLRVSFVEVSRAGHTG